VHLVLVMGKPLKMYANVLKDFHSSEKSKIYVYQIFTKLRIMFRYIYEILALQNE
jgi:hypothetical protein